MRDYSADLLGLYKLADSFYRTKFENDIYLEVKDYLNSYFNILQKTANVLDSAVNTNFSSYKATLSTNKNSIQELILKLEENPKKRIVMKNLLEIPPGKTICYGEFTALCGFNNAVRNTASLIAQNILPIIVPCHRVVRKDKIGNYIFGTEAKKMLVGVEGKNANTNRKQ